MKMNIERVVIVLLSFVLIWIYYKFTVSQTTLVDMKRNNIEIEYGDDGDYVVFSKKIKMVLGYLESTSANSGPVLTFGIGKSPDLLFFNIGSDISMSFMTSGGDHIYDRNCDGFPDSSLLCNGEQVELQVWAVNDEGGFMRRLGTAVDKKIKLIPDHY